MSFVVNDLVTDEDLLDYEPGLLDAFGQTTWQAKRQKALEDWLFPALKRRGFDPYRLRTRYEPDALCSYTGLAYADRTAAAKDTTADDLNLGAIFTTAGSDCLYVGSVQPFRGLFVRMLDTVSAVASVLSVAYYNGGWENLLVDDKTMHTAGKTFSGGGAVTWLRPTDWMTRAISTFASLYWVKVDVSATPTFARAGQISVIGGSSLRVPVTFRTLELIFREAPTSGAGPWREKADFYKQEAGDALQVALEICGGEFDTDQSDVLSTTEQAQTADQVSGGGWSLQRA